MPVGIGSTTGLFLLVDVDAAVFVERVPVDVLLVLVSDGVLLGWLIEVCVA